MSKRLQADHRIICGYGNDTLFGYFGWPSVCRLGEHELLAAASGFRTGHIDPFGKSVCFSSSDDGSTWSAPQVVNNSPIDDRDTGLVALGGGRALLTWFASDTRRYVRLKTRHHLRRHAGRMDFTPLTDLWEEEVVAANVGSFTRVREADGKWGPRRVSPVTSPHGPARLHDGTLLYLGNECHYAPGLARWIGEVTAVASRDEGATWERLGVVSGPEKGRNVEPHVLELPDGGLLGAIRYDLGFQVFLTRSEDGGRTWTVPELLVAGSPPALLLHSSGTIVMSYGWRGDDPGQRVAFSRDGGRTWSLDWILRDDGPDSDLGYPSTVELADGSLFTVYYQKACPGDLNCALMSSHWELPKF